MVSFDRHQGCVRARTTPAFLAGLVILGSSAWVAAQAPTQRAILLYREATIHYNLGEYELAVDKYSAAIHADPTVPGPYRNLGLTYRALDKCKLALPCFRKYLQLQPHGKYRARVEEQISFCAAKVGENSAPPLGSAQLVLEVSEEGAQIYIDGVLRGASPTGAIPLASGRHNILAYLAGFLPWNRTFKVSDGQVLALTADLEPDPKAPKPRSAKSKPSMTNAGTLRLLGIPHRANVSVDGVLVALDDDNTSRVASGSRRLQVLLSGTRPWSRTVAVRPRATTTVIAHLELTQTSRSVKKWGWIVTGAGAVLGIVGGVFGLLENRTNEQIRDYNRLAGTRAELNDMVSARRSQALTANLLYGLAAGAMATGIVLLSITPDVDRTED